MTAPDDLLTQYALPIHGAMRTFFGDPLYALDLFRAVPMEDRSEVLLLLLALAVGAESANRAVVPLHRDEEPIAPHPLVPPPGYEELVAERFGTVARRTQRRGSWPPRSPEPHH